MSERPRTLCPVCGQAIEPNETDVVEAEEVVPAPAFGAPHDTVPGLRRVFHESCWSEGDSNYRRV